MRVIAGKFRSRSLKSLKGLAMRPTSDRLRETLFNVLADRVPDARFVDAFAGTGAVGIEALSRGARARCPSRTPATGGESSDGRVLCGYSLSGPALRRRSRLSARLDVSWR